jgi:hypothetical protein
MPYLDRALRSAHPGDPNRSGKVRPHVGRAVEPPPHAVAVAQKQSAGACSTVPSRRWGGWRSWRYPVGAFVRLEVASCVGGPAETFRDTVKQLAATVKKGAAVHADGPVRETPAGSPRAIHEPARHRERGRRPGARHTGHIVIVGSRVGFAEEVMLAVHWRVIRVRGTGTDRSPSPPLSLFSPVSCGPTRPRARGRQAHRTQRRV